MKSSIERHSEVGKSKISYESGNFCYLGRLRDLNYTIGKLARWSGLGRVSLVLELTTKNGTGPT